MKFFFFRICFFFIGIYPISLMGQDTIKVTYYNLLDFPEHQADRVDTLKNILNHIQTDVLVVNELTSFNGGALIKNNALNVNGVSNYSSAIFYDGPDTDNLLFYDNTKLGLHSQKQIPTALRDISEYILFYKDPNLSMTQDTTYLNFYSIHLKAGNDPSDANLRTIEAEVFKTYLASSGKNSRLFVGGDFNFYNNSDQACQEILNGQGVNLYDPINRMGSWHNNAGYKKYHTQSTRESNGGYAGGSYGGMDDRFDFIFVSNDVLYGAEGVHYIDDSYEAVGQDGLRFNNDIHIPTNIAVSPSVANSLFYMSDHLPVSLEFAVGGTINVEEFNASIKLVFANNSKELSLFSDVEIRKLSLRIFDLNGRLIKVKSLNNIKESNWSLKFLPKGFYIASVKINDKIKNLKFVIN
jgi:hypothetical protein